MEVLQALPHNLDAERGVLGAILVHNDALLDVIDILQPEDFYRSANQIIFKTILDLYSKSIPIDIITIANVLGPENLQAAGGVTYLSEAIGSTIGTGFVKAHSEIIKEKSDRRKIIKACQKAIGASYSDENTPRGILGLLEGELLNTGHARGLKIKNDEDVMTRTLKMVEDNYKNGGGITGISTGFESLDKATNGLNRGRFIVIAGRPAMGKSCFALNLAQSVSEEKNVLLFSLEMYDTELGVRRLASKSLINSIKISKGDLNETEWATLMKKADVIATTGGMYTDDSASLTIHEIRARARKMKLQHGLDVVFIDHIGLITSTMKTDNKVRQMEDITRQLKVMAKELDVCVVGLSQLSRAPEAGAEKRPQLSHLRDSGSIEQDADTVMLLYRDEYYNPETDDKNVIEVNIAKNRTGRTGTIKYTWRPEYQLITERPHNNA